MAQLVGLRAVHPSARVRVPTQKPLPAPLSPVATPVSTGGTFAANTYFWKIVAINGSGGSVPSAQVTATIVLNGSATLTWAAVTGATGYRVFRGTTTNGEDHYQTTATNSFTDTGAAGTAATIPTVATGVTSAGLATLHTTTDTIVDVDDAATRLALVRHGAIHQYYVSALNATAHSGSGGALTALPSDA